MFIIVLVALQKSQMENTLSSTRLTTNPAFTTHLGSPTSPTRSVLPFSITVETVRARIRDSRASGRFGRAPPVVGPVAAAVRADGQCHSEQSTRFGSESDTALGSNVTVGGSLEQC